MKLKIKFDTDILALLIACLAVGMAFWEGYESRQHNRKSVVPIFNSFVNKTLGEELQVFEIGIQSVGLGPATIKSFKVFFNGREEPTYKAPGYETAYHTPILAVQGLLEDQKPNPQNPLYITTQDNDLASGEVVATEARRVLLKFESNLPREEFVKAIDIIENTMDIFVCYCSIYDDQCQFAHVGPNPDLLPQACKTMIEDTD